MGGRGCLSGLVGLSPRDSSHWPGTQHPLGSREHPCSLPRAPVASSPPGTRDPGPWEAGALPGCLSGPRAQKASLFHREYRGSPAFLSAYRNGFLFWAQTAALPTPIWNFRPPLALNPLMSGSVAGSVFLSLDHCWFFTLGCEARLGMRVGERWGMFLGSGQGGY